MAQRSIKQENPMWNIGTIACLTGAILVHEDVVISSNALAPGTTSSSSEFLGIAKGASPAANLKPLDVARVCIIETTLTSATYVLGAGMAWAAKLTMAADAGSETLGWFGQHNTAAATLGLVEINVFLLASVAANAKLYETPVA